MDDLGLEEPVDRLRQGIVVAVANAAHGWFNDEPFVRHWFKYNGECSAMRLKTAAYLEKTRIPITIDVGFGDALGNADYMLDYGSLLDYPSTVIAEKCQAVVALGVINGRMKDYYDLWAPQQGRRSRSGGLAGQHREDL